MLDDVIDSTMARIEASPAWIRPGLNGAALVYAFIIQRGGLVALPIIFVALAFTNPRELLIAVPAVLILAPGAGFLGGLFYGVTGLFVSRFGRLGKIVQFVAATWIYCVLLVFVIMPWADPSTARDIPAGINWIIATGMGIFFGGILGFTATRPN